MPTMNLPNRPVRSEFSAGVADYGVLAVAEQIVRRTVVPACACGLPRSAYEGHNCSANHWQWTAWPEVA